jgi:hypothetical protein
MKIPKRYETHLATGETTDMQFDAIRVSDDGKAIVATDGTIAARIPIGPAGVQPEPGEELVAGAVMSPKAWSEAVRGSTGTGTLRLEFGRQAAQSAPNKPVTLFEPPAFPEGSERPPIDFVLEQTDLEYQNLQVVDLFLDAEALHRLARAIGGKEIRIQIPIDVGSGYPRVVKTFGLRVASANGGTGVIMPVSKESA